MSDADALADAVRSAWSGVPAPPAADLNRLAWECGEESWRAFAGVAPLDVDTSSAGFLGCTPLLSLPPAAAAAYLGTYLLSLLEGVTWQERNVVFYDILTRAHLLQCLGDADFWQQVVRPHVPADGVAVLAEVCAFIVARRELLGMTAEEAGAIAALGSAAGHEG